MQSTNRKEKKMNKVLKIIIVIVICLILILAATLIFSQCSNNDVDQTTTSSSTTTTPKVDPDPNPECTTHIDANTDYLCDNCGAQLEKPEEGFTATNDKVYVITTQLNVRKTPDTNGNPVGSVLMDTELTRLGYYENGWSKIIYDGEECYVDTSSITTQKPITDADFTVVDETVYFTQNSLVWTKPSYIKAQGYSEAIDTFFAGESAKRIGVANVKYVDEDGEYTFAKIEYTVKIDGVPTTVVRYVNNDYLSTEAPNTDGSVVFEAVEEFLVLKVENFWLRKSTNYIESEKAVKIPQNTVLQAVARGVEADGTIWYKVIYDEQIYYAIYYSISKDLYYFDKQESVEVNFNYPLGEYNVSISETFVVSDLNGKEKEFVDSIHSIFSSNLSDLTLDETKPTLQQFATVLAEVMELASVEIQDKDGVVYFEFVSHFTVDEEALTVYSLVIIETEGEKNYNVTSLSGIGTKDELIDLFWGYIDATK